MLPERQINKKIYYSFERLIEFLNFDNWIKFYIFWELSLIKELGFEIDFLGNNNLNEINKKTVEINNQHFQIPRMLLQQHVNKASNNDIREALIFNKSIILQNFILPNRLRFPLSRNILEKYYS